MDVGKRGACHHRGSQRFGMEGCRDDRDINLRGSRETGWYHDIRHPPAPMWQPGGP